MTRHAYRLVDVFTATPFCGNPLAVFPDARGIREAQMQQIAAELNLSETTFVLPPTTAGCDFRVRIFTPQLEMPMAGHPTIGTAWVLNHGERVVFEEGVGPITVERARSFARVSEGRTLWRMAQLRPTWGARHSEPARIAAMLGLEASDLAEGLPLEVVTCGVPFLLVPLRSLSALGRARPRPDLWAAAMDGLGTGATYCFTLDTAEAGVDTRSRMFAPDLGVGEDAATGSASGPLGCYLVRHRLLPAEKRGRLLNVQGVEMKRRSEIHIEIDGTADDISGVRVGGESVDIGGGFLDLEG